MKTTYALAILGVSTLTLLAGPGQVAAIPLPDNSSCSVGGNTNTCLKITNTAISGSAITAITTGGIGALKASSTNGIGIQTSSTSNVGLYATSGSGIGIQATSTSNFGISALSGNSWAINASSSAVRPLGAVMGHANGIGYGVVGQNLVHDDNNCLLGNGGLNCAAAVFGDAGGPGRSWAGLFNGDVNEVLPGVPPDMAEIYINGSDFTLSDARMKTAVNDLPYGVEQVRALRPVTYKWKQVHDGRIQIGLIAQELQGVIPELVGSRGKADLLWVDYNGLIPVLVKAVQQREMGIRQREARITALEQAAGSGASHSSLGRLGAVGAFGVLPLGLFGFAVGRRPRNRPATRPRGFSPPT
jgi:hypothetical protein